MLNELLWINKIIHRHLFAFMLIDFEIYQPNLGEIVKYPENPPISLRAFFTRSNQFNNWRTWKNKVNTLIKDAKTDYYITILDKNKGNPQNFWKFLKN